LDERRREFWYTKEPKRNIVKNSKEYDRGDFLKIKKNIQVMPTIQTKLKKIINGRVINLLNTIPNIKTIAI